MKERVVAKRYGQALFELALESGDVTGVFSDLERLLQAAAEVPFLIRGLADERVKLSQRLTAARQIASVLALGKEAAGVFRLLIAKGRIDILPFVAVDFKTRMERHERLSIAKLGVVDPAAAKEIRGRIEEILSRALSVQARCDVEIDPDLIGGFTLAVGDVRYDASIRGKLERMKEEML